MTVMTSPPSIAFPQQNNGSQRANSVGSGTFPGLDALRAWSAVAVVVLHSCVPYCQPSMPGLVWSVTDNPSQSVTILMWAIEVVIMPIFLVVAGFFAARSMARSGAIPTLKNRCYRWGKILTLAIVFLIPIELYVWMLGWVADGLITPRNVQTLKFKIAQADHLWGFSHLWFLQYIITYVVVLWLGWEKLTRISPQAFKRLGLPICMTAAIVTLTCSPEVVWGFQHSFFPVFSKWIYSGLFFAAGAILWRCDPDLKSLSFRGERLLALSTLFWIASIVIGLWWLKQNTTLVTVRMTLAVLTVVPAVGVTFGLIGVSIRHIHELGTITQRLAGASLLIYLLHHPVVGLSHITAKYAFPNAPASIKVLFVATLGVAAGLAVDFLWRSRAQRIRLANERVETQTILFSHSKIDQPSSAQEVKRAA